MFSTFSLRDYQQASINAIKTALDTADSTMLVLATGLGKTECFVNLLHNWEGRSMVICPMVELVAQAAKKIAKRTRIAPAIEQADQRANEAEWAKSPFVVGSKQSLMAGRGSKRYARFNDIGLVIVDECHLAATEEYAELLGHFKAQGAKLLGVTATPKRHDQRAMGQLFETCAYQYGICDAVPDGWLVPAQTHCVVLESLDLADVPNGMTTHGKDFNTKQLNAALEEDKTIFEIADVTAKETAGLRTVIYCSSVREAQGVAEKLRDSYGIKAEWICSDERKCPQHKRTGVLRDFTEGGEVTHVANVGILTTGWDFPGLEAIVQARPTQSEALYTQIFGRGTRPLEGVVDFADSTPDLRRAAILASAKPHFKMIDLVDTSMSHRIVTAIDVLGGKFSLVAREKAKQAAKQGAVDANQALIDAQRLIELEQEERERRRRAMVEANATYKKVEVNPIGTAPQGQSQKAKTRAARIPFGKHAGKLVSELPHSYMRWMLKQHASGEFKLKPWLEQAMKDELGGGVQPMRAPNPPRISPPLMDVDAVNAMLAEAARG